MILRFTNIMILLVLLFNPIIAECEGCENDDINSGVQDFYLPQNGLKIILKEEHSMPIVGMSLFYNVGSHDEPVGIKGMTKLQLYLSEESGNTDGTSAEDIKQKISLTQSSKIYSDRDVFSITHEFNKNYLQEMLQLEADRMEFLNITDSSLVRAKNEFKNDSPYKSNAKLKKAVGELNQFTDEHPYAFTDWGRSEDIDSISVEMAIDYREKYFNPNNATLVLVGDFKSAEMVGVINNIFGAIKNKSRVPVDPEFAINDQPHTIIDGEFSQEARDIPFLYGQVVLCNINIPSFRNDDMIVVEHIMNLLAYDNALSGEYSEKYIDKTGVFTQPHIVPSMGPSEAKFIIANAFKRKSHKSLKRSLKKMIAKLARDGFDEKLLNKYKKRELIRDYKKGYEYKNAAMQLGRAELVLGNYNHYNRTTKILEKLDNEEIKRVVLEYFLNEEILAIELKVGKWRWHTPIMSFFVNGILKPLLKDQMDRILLPSDTGLFN